MTNSNLAIAAQQFRAEVTFKKVRDLLAAKNIAVILLKGPHLGATVYDSPKERLYADIDVLVREKDFDVAATVLLANNFQPFAFTDFDPEVQRDFKHWEYRSPWGVIVELHRWLSGHDRYPVDSDRLFDGAEKFNFGETPALGLGAEDLLLHLCLHMGTSYFHVIERKHVADIGLLIKKRDVDWQAFLQNVKMAGARSIVYYALLAAQLQQGAPVPPDFMRRIRPGKWRRIWLEKYIDPGSYPIYRFPEDSIKNIKRKLLLPLMDRPGQWAGFIRRMAGTKFRMVKRMVKRKLGERREARGKS